MARSAALLVAKKDIGAANMTRCISKTKTPGPPEWQASSGLVSRKHQINKVPKKGPLNKRHSSKIARTGAPRQVGRMWRVWRGGSLPPLSGLTECRRKCGLPWKELPPKTLGRLGTAPWHPAILTCANLVIEIAAEDESVGWDLTVLGAPEQVLIMHAIMKIWGSKPPMTDKMARPDCRPLGSALSATQRLQAACQARPFPSQVPTFIPTQKAEEEGDLEAVDGQRGDPGAVDWQGASKAKVLNFMGEEVPPLSEGCGPSAHTVQDQSLGAILYPDRVTCHNDLMRELACLDLWFLGYCLVT